MNFEILTQFPNMLTGFFGESMLKRAADNGHISIRLTDIRDYSHDKHRRTDDTPYGGGFGMVMLCAPAVEAIRECRARLSGTCKTVYLSPRGRVFSHKIAAELAEFDNLILFCGHYEGIDQRIIELEIDEEISVGDYVLTGGELPAAIIVDAVARLIDGVLPDPECYKNESHASGLLEFPHYTKPRVFEDLEVPEVLVNGNHAKIEEWRHEKSLEITKKNRPDLYRKFNGEKNIATKQ